jgi:hypothetical protein
MAGFFKKALGAFVEIDETADEVDAVSVEDLDEEARRLLAEIESGGQTPPQGAAYAAQARAHSERAPTNPGAKVPASALPTGRPFEDIYATAGVPASPYSAEMLLRVADGLKALPVGQARAAVDAMDAADDRWTVGDVLLDAERKIGALRAVEGSMDAQRRAAQEQYDASVHAIDAQITEAEQEINRQIAELKALLKDAQETATVERAKALSELEATRAAASGEVARLQAEVARLQKVYEFLGEPQG